MGGTWREGHFDTGFGLKNDLQCQTGGIGIQRRPAIPVKRVQFLTWIGFLNLQMNGIWIAVVDPKTNRLNFVGCVFQDAMIGLRDEIGLHEMGHGAATRHRKTHRN